MKALERVLENAEGAQESEEVEDRLRIEWSAEGLDDVRRGAQLALVRCSLLVVHGVGS